MEQPLTRIFLLSHMRAYSSLIGHILGSHARINGYYEMHQGYQSAQDLQRSIEQYRQHDAIKPDSRFFFDKLLHNDYPLDLNLPPLKHATVLLALRPPEASIKSIIKLFRQKPQKHRYAEAAQAARYYRQRLAFLDAFSQQYAGRFYYFDAELIQSDSHNLLQTLTDWLQLDTPLQAQYQTFARSGQARAGDSSDAIRSGRIMPPTNPHDDIVLTPTLLQSAQQDYANVRNRLISHSTAAAALDSLQLISCMSD